VFNLRIGDDLMENDSGINSLAGFSYQMKVFILKSATLNENEKIE
jgi:hypothetical protein